MGGKISLCVLEYESGSFLRLCQKSVMDEETFENMWIRMQLLRYGVIKWGFPSAPFILHKINCSNKSEKENVKHYIKRNPTSIYLKPADAKEILKIVQELNNKTSTDCNGLNMTVVKKVIDSFVDLLICNLSFQTSTFPQIMKIAKVLPLYKSGDKHQVTNDRPVSVLCLFKTVFLTKL